MQMASQPGYDVVNMKEVLKVEWSFKFSFNQAGLVINLNGSVCFGLFVHHRYRPFNNVSLQVFPRSKIIQVDSSRHFCRRASRLISLYLGMPNKGHYSS